MGMDIHGLMPKEHIKRKGVNKYVKRKRCRTII